MKVLDKVAEAKIPKVMTKAPLSWKGVLFCSVEIFVCALVVVLVLEAVLAFAGLGEEEYLRMDEVAGWVPMEGKHFTHRGEGFSRGWFNSIGMPDVERSKKKPAGVFRIALVGDSLTEGFSVHPGHRFGDLLEKRLNSEFPDRHFEVLNFGVPAYNIAQKYLRLKNLALDYEPDIAIMQCRETETLSLGPSVNGWTSAKPDFALDGKGHLFENRFQQVRWHQSAEGRRMRDTFLLRRYSRIWGAIGQQMQSLSIWQRQTWRQWDRVLKGKWLVATPAGSQKPAGPTDAQLETAMKHFCALACVFFDESKAAAEKRGCTFTYVLFPRPPQSQSTIETKVFRTHSLKSGIPYDDLNPTFESFPLQMRKKLFKGSHLSNEGNQVAADKLFEFLNGSGLLKQAKQ
ncbi:MAG: hypothetical protein C0469_06650 [Cyanobacteria bacterium DS2.3.42]|nr:hypothetical protein [Cyanobacteria bacterium DS2.3.42]